LDHLTTEPVTQRGRVVEFRAAGRRRLHEEVAEQLRDAILDGNLPAGQKLPPERVLAERFAVNRTSVREAIKVLEGLGLVSVRQGDGVTVRPIEEASIAVLGPMIFHGGRVDAALVREMSEVVSPLLLEMGRLAIERARREHVATLRALRDVVADEARDREERFGALRDLLVALADMTGNRVWQMLARRMRALLASPPLVETRERLRRDPGRLVGVIDGCLAALGRGDRAEATRNLDALLRVIGAETEPLGTTRRRPATKNR
jgi:GntR family transcriptional repressor for pyruvate dehydrogenase complex